MFSCRNDRFVTNIMANTHGQLKNDFIRLSEETGKEEMAIEREQSAVLRKVEFENNRITVVRFRFGPHAQIPLHAAPDLVAVWLTDARLKLTFPDGTSKVEYRKAGGRVGACAKTFRREPGGCAARVYINTVEGRSERIST